MLNVPDAWFDYVYEVEQDVLTVNDVYCPLDEFPEVGQYTSEDLEFLDRARASEVADADR